MNLKNLFTLATIGLLGTFSAFSEEITEMDVFKDSKTGRYMHVCKTEGETHYVAETCGKYWEKAPRKRSELIKQVEEYKDLKRYDPVMIYVMRDGEPKWVMGTVNFMYEDGSISVMEYYSHHGYNTGTLNWTVPYSNISKKVNTPEASSSEVCAKEDIEIIVGHNNEKKYKISKGEKLEVKEVYANGIMSVKLDGFLVNLWRYGHNNKLPIANNKVEACPQTIAVNDGPRMLKPVSDDGAGSPSSGSKTKNK